MEYVNDHERSLILEPASISSDAIEDYDETSAKRLCAGVSNHIPTAATTPATSTQV